MVALAETVKRYQIPDRAVRGPDLGLRARPDGHGIPDLRRSCSIIARGRPTRSAISSFTSPARSTPRTPRLSDATCTALQLANFWQDVARDLAIGRIYLPREDRDRSAIPTSDLHALRFTPAFAELLRFEVARARELLPRVEPLCRAFRAAGRRCRPVFARRLGHPRSDRGPRIRRPERRPP